MQCLASNSSKNSSAERILPFLASSKPCQMPSLASPRGKVEQTLACFRLLNDRCRFHVHGQYHRTLALLDLLLKSSP